MQLTAPSASPGEMLAGKYRVDRVIGEGGMGIVLAATNQALRQKVAIKLLRPGALGSAEGIGRFQREARAAASLRSQHVARVLDVGALADGRPFMVMELLEGEDLGDVIEKRSPVPVSQAVDFVLQACEAIAEAHGAGIVHRDLKPKNLFLTTTVDGRPLVKVLDFGISKMIDAGAPDMQLTRTTEIIGSPSYMSPEQLRSARHVDARTDIWALGVILYELLTTRLPFYAQTITELVLVVATEREHPVNTLRPDVPLALAEVVARCLSKKPEERIQTVEELAMLLEPFAQVGETSAAARVRGVALQSGRSVSGPPPSPSAPASNVTGPTSSARINVHGAHAGTSVAWSETQAEPSNMMTGPPPPTTTPTPTPPPGASRGTTAAVLGVAGLVLAGAISGGGLLLYKRAGEQNASGATPAAPEPPPLPLPTGRKDLPPLPTTTTDPVAEPQASAAATPSATVSAQKPSAPKPKPHSQSDDLSNIGRR